MMLDEAIEAMADALSGSEGATAHFTCAEVDSLLKVLVVANLEDAAVEVLIGHVYGDGWNSGDDEGDRHFHLRNDAKAMRKGVGGKGDRKRAKRYLREL